MAKLIEVIRAPIWKEGRRRKKGKKLGKYTRGRSRFHTEKKNIAAYLSDQRVEGKNLWETLYAHEQAGLHRSYVLRGRGEEDATKIVWEEGARHAI